jgi:CRP-like cAMP-binding protein
MYYFNENAKEFTCHISFNDSENLIDNFSIDFHSFTTKTPSIYEIEALKDTQIVELAFEDLKYISQYTQVLDELTTKVNSLIHSTIRDGLISKNISSNTQRYEDFIQRYNPIYNKIPQYIIASYLGITPVGLSKLINK